MHYEQCLQDSEWEDACCVEHYNQECSNARCKDPSTYLRLPETIPFETTARPIDSSRLGELKADFRSQPIIGVTALGSIPINADLFTQITPSLWMGGTPAGIPNKYLPGVFTSVLNLYKWEPYLMWSSTDYLEVTMLDSIEGADWETIDMLSDWTIGRAGVRNTLVHCQAGLNRSGLVVGATLVKMGYTPDDAIALMRYKRSPAVLANPKFEQQLRGMVR